MIKARKTDLQTLQILTQRADFAAANKRAKKWVSHGLVLQVLPNDISALRVGYTVTKKTDKSAVKRNRIKRRLRAAAADVLPFEAQSGYDYILIGRHGTATRPYQTLLKDLRWCLKKLERRIDAS